eukprot:scaffold54679_cov29-Phaeocystis_antarctica.AAC.1
MARADLALLVRGALEHLVNALAHVVGRNLRHGASDLRARRQQGRGLGVGNGCCVRDDLRGVNASPFPLKP